VVDLLEKVKLGLRLTADDLDGEIADVIAACKMDLQLAGIVHVSDDDPLIIRAATLYAKAHVGYDDNAERFQTAYDSLKLRLKLARRYNAMD
jgi:hypothetical protein